MSRASTPKMTAQTMALLEVMLTEPTTSVYGLELAKRAKLYTGTLYPILRRLEKAGWLESHWEEVDPSTAGRPRRRLYRLTRTGRLVGSEAVERRQRSLGIAARPYRQPAGGIA